MISIDGQQFDPSSEHFSFDLYHQIDDMRELAKLRAFANLKSANFCGSGLDDVGLRYVSDVPTLENLNLQDTRISDDGLCVLVRLPNLKYLRLKENAQLSNACIPHLLKLKQLTDLQIHKTAIDQRGLNQLVGMEALRGICLDVWKDNYSLEELLDFSVRMPECTILVKGRGEFFQGGFTGTWDE